MPRWSSECMRARGGQTNDWAMTWVSLWCDSAYLVLNNYLSLIYLFILNGGNVKIWCWVWCDRNLHSDWIRKLGPKYLTFCLVWLNYSDNNLLCIVIVHLTPQPRYCLTQTQLIELWTMPHLCYHVGKISFCCNMYLFVLKSGTNEILHTDKCCPAMQQGMYRSNSSWNSTLSPGAFYYLNDTQNMQNNRFKNICL